MPSRIVALRCSRAALKLTLVAALAALLLVVSTSPVRRAGATFHAAQIDEAMFGINGDPNQQYVEIKMLSSGQNLVAGTRLSAWNANGSFFGVLLQVPSAVTSGANLRWIMGTPQYAAVAGIQPDFTFTAAALPSTGMICWGAPGLVAQNPPMWDATLPSNYVDCLPYNGYAAGNISHGPASSFGLGDGTQSLTRVATSGSASTDYALACPSPQAITSAIGLNHDLHIGLRFLRSFDDLTWPNSDTVGDNCGDNDDDNDGLTDATETGGPPCASASAPTDPLNRDSDGDLVLDGAECALGTDPANIASKPTLTACGPSGDADADGLSNRLEFCGYNSNANSANTDGDACGDAREVTTVNGDLSVNAGDLGLVASSFGGYALPGPADKVDFDVNKDGTISAGDLGIVASKFGSCP